MATAISGSSCEASRRSFLAHCRAVPADPVARMQQPRPAHQRPLKRLRGLRDMRIWAGDWWRWLYDPALADGVMVRASACCVYLAHGRAPVRPYSAGAWIELGLLWAVTGAYLVTSWRRGGATIGMRPWRLWRVLAADSRPATVRAGTLRVRYAVATLSLLAGGLGFIWALFDEERRCWHDMAAETRLVRMDRAVRKPHFFRRRMHRCRTVVAQSMQLRRTDRRSCQFISRSNKEVRGRSDLPPEIPPRRQQNQ